MRLAVEVGVRRRRSWFREGCGAAVRRVEDATEAGHLEQG